MLPVRGVMAAAMLCPPHAGTEGDAHNMSMSAGGGHADEADTGHADGGADHDHSAATSGHHHDGASGTDTCNLCSACCSVPPVPSAAPAVPLPHSAATTVFPSFTAPAPTFQSEGPERPPRSI